MAVTVVAAAVTTVTRAGLTNIPESAATRCPPPFLLFPPPGTIDLASEDVVVDVDLEKDSAGHEIEVTGIDEEDDEDGVVVPESAPQTEEKSSGGKKTWLWAGAALLVVVVVVIGAVVGTKDQRSAKAASSSEDVYACSTSSTLTCPAFADSSTTNNTMQAFEVGEPITGEDSQDLFGMALSTNCDGTIMAVGSSQHDDRSGHVKVYQWVARSSDLTPEERASLQNTTDVGAWMQLGQTLDGEIGSRDQFGHAISLSHDGKRLAVSGRFADTSLSNGTAVENVGSVVVFEMENEEWQAIGQVILGEAEDDQSGRSLEFNWDGTRLIVGATGNDGNADKAGHARVYEWKASSTSWEQLGSDIDGEAEADASGNAVSISADGNTVAVGAYKNDAEGSEDAGHVRVFAYSQDAGDWQQVGGDIDGDANDDWTGMSVALSGSGDRLVVGAPGSNDRFWPGVSKVYDFVNNTAWVQLGEDLEGGGYSVDITFDGNRVALGSHRGFENGSNSGQVLIYDYQSESTKWVSSLGEDALIAGEAGSLFGTRVAMSSDGRRVVASAPGSSGNGMDPSLSFVGSVSAYDLCPVLG